MSEYIKVKVCDTGTLESEGEEIYDNLTRVCKDMNVTVNETSPHTERCCQDM